MEICSLRNENMSFRWVYSDILNRKFPPKKPFRLARNAWRFRCHAFEWQTATGSKTSSLFICLNATTFVLISVITLKETICLKICPRTTANVKSPLPAGVDKTRVTDRITDRITTKPGSRQNPDHGPDRRPHHGSNQGPDHGSSQGRNFKIQNSRLKIPNWFCRANNIRVTIVSCRTFYLIQVWFSFIPLIYNNKGQLLGLDAAGYFLFCFFPPFWLLFIYH